MTTEPTVVVQRAYDWTLWIIPKVEKFRKPLQFSLGQSLITSSTELLLNLVDATYQARNAGPLAAAAREVNRIRYLTRLAKDLHAITVENHEFAAQAMEEIGRMTGGWLKSTKLHFGLQYFLDIAEPRVYDQCGAQYGEDRDSDNDDVRVCRMVS